MYFSWSTWANVDIMALSPQKKEESAKWTYEVKHIKKRPMTATASGKQDVST